jgi:hypothetical protein
MTAPLEDDSPTGQALPEDEKEVSYPERPEWPDEPAPLADGVPVVVPERGGWSRTIGEWLYHHHPEREQDEPGRMPRPYLRFLGDFIQGRRVTSGMLRTGSVSLTLVNEGNVPAWNCYVEVYEGPFGGLPPAGYSPRGRMIITLHPHERRTVSVPWWREMTGSNFLGIVYDPLMDPRDFSGRLQSNRKIIVIQPLDHFV